MYHQITSIFSSEPLHSHIVTFSFISSLGFFFHLCPPFNSSSDINVRHVGNSFGLVITCSLFKLFTSSTAQDAVSTEFWKIPATFPCFTGKHWEVDPWIPRLLSPGNRKLEAVQTDRADSDLSSGSQRYSPLSDCLGFGTYISRGNWLARQGFWGIGVFAFYPIPLKANTPISPKPWRANQLPLLTLCTITTLQSYLLDQRAALCTMQSCWSVWLY